MIDSPMQALNITIFGIIAVSKYVEIVNDFASRAIWVRLHPNINNYASSVPELYFFPAQYRGWTRAGERRVQDNLHAHAQNEAIKNYRVPTTLLAS